MFCWKFYGLLFVDRIGARERERDDVWINDENGRKREEYWNKTIYIWMEQHIVYTMHAFYVHTEMHCFDLFCWILFFLCNNNSNNNNNNLKNVECETVYVILDVCNLQSIVLFCVVHFFFPFRFFCVALYYSFRVTLLMPAFCSRIFRYLTQSASNHFNLIWI